MSQAGIPDPHIKTVVVNPSPKITEVHIVLDWSFDTVEHIVIQNGDKTLKFDVSEFWRTLEKIHDCEGWDYW